MGFLVLVFHVFVWTRSDVSGATRDQNAAIGTILQAPTKAVTPWQEFTTPEGKARDQLRCVMCFIVLLAANALPLPFPASPTTTTALPKKPDGRSRRSRSPGEDGCCVSLSMSLL